MADPDGLTPDEQWTADLVERLTITGHLQPLIDALRDGEAGPEQARDALQLLGELDLRLLVQVAVGTLLRDYVDTPGLAAQRRRVVRGPESTDGSSG